MNAPRVTRPTFLPHGNAGEQLSGDREIRFRPPNPNRGTRG